MKRFKKYTSEDKSLERALASDAQKPKKPVTLKKAPWEKNEANDAYCSDECCGSDVKAEDCPCPADCDHCNCNSVKEEADLDLDETFDPKHPKVMAARKAVKSGTYNGNVDRNGNAIVHIDGKPHTVTKGDPAAKNEAVDQLDELSPATLKSYKKKATKQYKQSANKRMPGGGDYGSATKAAQDKHQKRFDKRHKGIGSEIKRTTDSDIHLKDPKGLVRKNPKANSMTGKPAPYKNRAESLTVKEDYTAGSEKSQFGGHRAQLKNKEGKTSYLGGKSYKKPKHAAGEAQAYHDHYFKGLGGNERAANKAVSDYRNKNKKHMHESQVKDEVSVVLNDYLTNLEEGGLWANIHAKRKRIKNGSGEKMKKPGSKGAPTDQDFKDASESVEEAFSDWKIQHPTKSTKSYTVKARNTGEALKKGHAAAIAAGDMHKASDPRSIQSKHVSKNESTVDEGSCGSVNASKKKVSGSDKKKLLNVAGLKKNANDKNLQANYESFKESLDEAAIDDITALYINENNITLDQLEDMTEEELNEIIGKAIGGAFKLGAKAVVGTARLAGKAVGGTAKAAKAGANRVSASGRADAAEKKADAAEKKAADRERITAAKQRVTDLKKKQRDAKNGTDAKANGTA